LLAKGSRGKGDLTKLDVAAQAALIRQSAEQLGNERPEVAAFIEAFYLPSPQFERVARGGSEILDRFGPKRGKAIGAVGYWLMKQAPKQHNLKSVGFEELVAQYVLMQPNNDRLCARLGLRRERANEVRGHWYSILDVLRAQAIRLADAKLHDEGLL
jgi:hypothetical protein